MSTKTATKSHDYEVGDILSALWGYDCSIVSFYQVIATTPKMVTVKPIGKRRGEPNQWGEQPVFPDPDAEVYYQAGQTFRRKVSSSGGVSVTDSQYATRWTEADQARGAYENER